MPAPAQSKPHTPKPSEVTEVTKAEPAVTLPKGEYPEFNYQRLLEMGLSEKEAKEFIQELIPQIGDQIPLIDEAIKVPDFHKMERLTHSIKGSSTTIGTGGVSDLLVEFNTYLKEGENVQIAQAYQTHLKRYFEKLKKQFPQED
jgi:HPt (histidine-containing phosphotransfer) domain-containing protein